MMALARLRPRRTSGGAMPSIWRQLSKKTTRPITLVMSGTGEHGAGKV